MARRRQHGGYRQPTDSAGVSGPGALSQRTDGGPGELEYSGLAYGENKAVNDQAGAVPLAGQRGADGTAPPTTGGGGRVPQGGAFGPTTRPDEAMTAGVNSGPGPGQRGPVLEEDPYLMIRALMQVAPSPQLEQMLARLSRG